jgi:DNA-binding PadR family transcriptional regulator
MDSLGYLEEMVLLLILTMNNEAYGLSVSEAYQTHTGKSISISAIHTVLSRLEKKGLIRSEMRGATEERGGRRKRIFEASAAGRETIDQIRLSREQLWSRLPRTI